MTKICTEHVRDGLSLRKCWAPRSLENYEWLVETRAFWRVAPLWVCNLKGHPGHARVRPCHVTSLLDSAATYGSWESSSAARGCSTSCGGRRACSRWLHPDPQHLCWLLEFPTHPSWGRGACTALPRRRQDLTEEGVGRERKCGALLKPPLENSSTKGNFKSFPQCQL